VYDEKSTHLSGSNVERGQIERDEATSDAERFEVPIEKLGRLLIVEDAWIAAVSSPYREVSA
jgi:hypothetical protein